MVANGGIATVGKRAGASVAYARHVVGAAAEIPSGNPTKTKEIIMQNMLER